MQALRQASPDEEQKRDQLTNQLMSDWPGWETSNFQYIPAKINQPTLAFFPPQILLVLGCLNL